MSNRRISEIQVGEVVWTVPWSLHTDVEGKKWISADAGFKEKSIGCYLVRVERTEAGYLVDSLAIKDWESDHPPRTVSVRMIGPRPILMTAA